MTAKMAVRNHHIIRRLLYERRQTAAAVTDAHWHVPAQQGFLKCIAMHDRCTSPHKWCNLVGVGKFGHTVAGVSATETSSKPQVQVYTSNTISVRCYPRSSHNHQIGHAYGNAAVERVGHTLVIRPNIEQLTTDCKQG